MSDPDTSDEVETISLEEYNKYAEAEEAAFKQSIAEHAPDATFARDLNDTVTIADHLRTQYWTQKMIESCGAGAGEMEYDAQGNPV